MVMFTMLMLLTSGAIMLVVERSRVCCGGWRPTPIRRGRSSPASGRRGWRLALVQVCVRDAGRPAPVPRGLGPSLPMVALVLVAWAAFNASLALLLGNIARTQARWPASACSRRWCWRRWAAAGGRSRSRRRGCSRSHSSFPTGWTMDALHKLVNFGDGRRSLCPHVAALLTGALVLGWIGARTFKYQ